MSSLCPPSICASEDAKMVLDSLRVKMLKSVPLLGIYPRELK